MASSSSPAKSKRSSYDAFKEVDQLVSKPVLGSDGAASWQDFRQKHQTNKKRTLAAPLAPLKASDRAAGFKSWSQERDHEDEVRKTEGHASLKESGYTHFRQKDQQDNKQGPQSVTDPRIRPDEVPYFLPATEFEGWKFDYIFTTRDRRIGYYWDGMDTFKQGQEPEAAKEPLAQQKGERKASLVPSKSGDETSKAPKVKKKKKRKKKAEGPVIVHDANNPLEQVAAVLEKQRQLASLPEGWKAAQDTNGRQYYYCERTKERSWEFPSAAAVGLLPSGWSAAKDPSSGKEYYYHAATKETRWDRPTS